MVEGSPLIADTVVAQGTKKRHQRSLVCGRQIDLTDIGSEVSSRRKVALPGVELHDLFQGRLTAIVEIGAGKFDIPQPRRLEGPGGPCPRGSEQGQSETIESAKTDVIGERRYAGCDSPSGE